MTEQYKTYVFFHSLNSNQGAVQTAYDNALAVIEADGGTPVTMTSYPSQGNNKVSIIYKSSVPN